MFSIVIPYYNKAKYIQRCIDSVWNQSFNEYEIILVNDGATDNGLHFLTKQNSKNITIVNQENKGVSEARNAGIAIAKNQYIAFLDADDCWHPNYLEKVKELIDKESDVKIIGSKYARNIDFIKEECDDLDYFKFDDYFKAALKNTYFTSSSTIVAMSFFTHNYGFNSNLKSGEDIDVWFRAVYSGGNAYYINNQLVYYSDEDENQVTKSKPDLKKSLVGNISNLYAEELKSNHNKSFRKLVSVYIYFNLYPYLFDLRYREEAKKVLNENQLFLFWLNLLYILPFSIGEKLMQSKKNSKKIRLYLKFIIRYIYT